METKATDAAIIDFKSLIGRCGFMTLKMFYGEVMVIDFFSD